MAGETWPSTWYHGSPLQLTTLAEGNTVTPDIHLAKVFSHKPALVSISDDGQVKHSGTAPGFLYRVAEPLEPGDVYPHPRSVMEGGKEWLTCRMLPLELLSSTEVVENESLTDEEIRELQARLSGNKVYT